MESQDSIWKISAVLFESKEKFFLSYMQKSLRIPLIKDWEMIYNHHLL